jgi:hypothetical protein
MSTNWVKDMQDMHAKFGVNQVVRGLDKAKLNAFLQFRIKFLQEELDEMIVSNNGDDTVDALIDLCVVAIGTLDALDVDAYTAWDRVLEANMAKEVGIKASRPNPLSLPDLIKKPDWIAPYHWDNTGLLSKMMPTGEPKNK